MLIDGIWGGKPVKTHFSNVLCDITSCIPTCNDETPLAKENLPILVINLSNTVYWIIKK